MSTDINYGDRARIGMLLPSGNAAAEPQLTRFLPAGVSLHVTRIKLTSSDESDLLEMARGAAQAAELVADAAVKLIVFHCTAVTTWDPSLEEKIVQDITARTGIAATTTAAALVDALNVIGAKKITLISPYVAEINQREAAFLRSFGFEIVNSSGLGITQASEMIEVLPQKWIEQTLTMKNDATDAYLISCTAIRSIEVIDELEEKLGKPVITSNQAMLWHSLRKAGIPDHIQGCGELLAKH